MRPTSLSATTLHSLGIPGSRTPRLGSSRFGRSLQHSQLGVALFAEVFQFAAFLVEQAHVVVAVAVGFVAGRDGVVAEFAGVGEGGCEGFDLELVFGGFLGGGG